MGKYISNMRILWLVWRFLKLVLIRISFLLLLLSKSFYVPENFPGKWTIITTLISDLILPAELGGVLEDPLIVDLKAVLREAGVLDCWYAEDTGETEETQLGQEGSGQSSRPHPPVGSHGVAGDAGGLVSVGGGGEVVQQVGEGGGEAAVVLRGHHHQPLAVLQHLVSLQHPLRGLGLILPRMKMSKSLY